MNISFVLSNHATFDPNVDLARVKEIGSFWGGWRTWRSCQTDNVICNDQIKAAELIQRQFQNKCNFYIPNSVYLTLGRPDGVKVYEGTFVHDVDNQEDIVAMHLAATTSDIVLLLGFDFGDQPKLQDRLEEHKAYNYRNLTRQVIVNNAKVQWVILEHPKELRKDLLDLSNLGMDYLSNIVQS